MNEHPRDLVALLGSRICHDLISPIGAIGNGLELISMSGKGNGPEMALINESVRNAQARIQFYRISFGANGGSQGLGSPQIAEILANITSGTRLSIDWQVTGEVRRDDAKLVLLLIQCLETTLAYGGRISVKRTARHWELTAKANKFRPIPDLWLLLTHGDTGVDLTPAQIQFALAPQQAVEIGRKIHYTGSETEITLTF